MVNKKTDINITAIIKTFNNDKYLYEILESVKELNEIIIVDYHSNDDTIEIANEYKAKVIYCDKNDYSSLDYIIKEAQNDWILIIDKNEIVPKNLLNKISNYIDNPKKNKNIVAFLKKSFYLNKEIKFLKSKKEIRLFKKDLCSLEYDFSVKPNEKKSKIYYVNKNFKNKNEYILKFIDNDISSNIQEIIEKNRNNLKFLKSKKTSIIIKPLWIFFKYYILKGGFMDGRLGYLFCKMKFFEDFILQCMILENNFQGEKYDI